MRVTDLVQVEIIGRSRQSVSLLLLGAQPFEHFVKDVVVALVGRLSDDARLLQQVFRDLGTGNHPAIQRKGQTEE